MLSSRPFCDPQICFCMHPLHFPHRTLLRALGTIAKIEQYLSRILSKISPNMSPSSLSGLKTPSDLSLDVVAWPHPLSRAHYSHTCFCTFCYFCYSIWINSLSDNSSNLATRPQQGNLPFYVIFNFARKRRSADISNSPTDLGSLSGHRGCST